MNALKHQYIETIRANSAYPTYRGFIGAITLLGYLLAAVVALGTLIGSLSMMSSSFALGLVVLAAGLLGAALTFLLARLWKEAAQILADIGDATVETNARRS